MSAKPCLLIPPVKKEASKVKKQHLQKLQMLISILNAAVRRIEGLSLKEQNEKLPAILLGRKGPIKTDPDLKGNVTAGHFIQMLRERGLTYTPRSLLRESEHSVTRAKALELLDLLEMEENMNTVDRKVQEAFGPFLECYGLTMKTLLAEDAEKIRSVQFPRDRSPMDARMFVEFLHQKYERSGNRSFRDRFLDVLLTSWSEQVVGDVTEAVKNYLEKSMRDKIRQKQQTVKEAKPPVPLTHSFPLAVFLL